MTTCYVHRCTRPGTATGRFVGMCQPDAVRAARIVHNARTR